MPSETSHVITKAEAEYELDRCEFERLMQRRGGDTVLLWWYQLTLHLKREDRLMIRGTDTDVR